MIDFELYKVNIVKIVFFVLFFVKVILVFFLLYFFKGKVKDLGLEYYFGIKFDCDFVYFLLYNFKVCEFVDNFNEVGDRKGNVVFCDIWIFMERVVLEELFDDLEEGFFKYFCDGVYFLLDGY